MRSVPPVILGVAPNLVTDEAFIVLHMFSSFYRGETNGINVHGIRVLCCSGKERPDATSSSESSDSFLLDCGIIKFVEPSFQEWLSPFFTHLV